MTTKHTPGPWACVEFDVPAQWRIDSAHCGPVADVDHHRAEYAANAALIAAAPDLLTVLQSILDLHIAHHNHPTHAAARAAIAKATGIKE